MVESQANQLSEEIMLGAVNFGHQQMQTVINAINEFAKVAAKPAWELAAAADNSAATQKVASSIGKALGDAYLIKEKPTRKAKIDELRNQVLDELCNDEENCEFTDAQVLEAFENLEYKIVRERILAGEPRIDGRDTKTVSPITV